MLCRDSELVLDGKLCVSTCCLELSPRLVYDVADGAVMMRMPESSLVSAGADVVIVDLEGAVSPVDKDSARASVSAWL